MAFFRDGAMYCTRAPLCLPLIIISILGIISLRQASGNYGMDFLIVLPRSQSSDTIMYMYATPYNSSSRVRLNWTIPSRPTQYGQSSVGATQVQIVQFDSNPTASAVRVSTEYPMVVAVAVASGKQGDASLATYLASPTNELSSAYTVVTHCETVSCFLIIASAYSNVEVTVALSLIPVNGNVTYEGVTYFNGDVINLKLNALSAVQIYSRDVDVTGSRITSTQPVQVVAGGGVDPSGSASNSKNMLIEQMPNENNLGTEFVLINLASKSNMLTTVKIVFTQKNTRVNFVGSDIMLLLNTTKWSTYIFRNDVFAFLSTNKPVIVEMIFEVVTNNTVSSMASVVVPPVDRWASRYVTLTTMGTIVLVTTESCTSRILMNNKTANPTSLWTQASKYPQYFYTSVKIVTYNILQFVLEGPIECTFGGYAVYGKGNGYTAFPLGWSKFQFHSSLSPLVMSTATERMHTLSDLVSLQQSQEIVEHSLQPMQSSVFDIVHTVTMAFSTLPAPTSYKTGNDGPIHTSILYSTETVASTEFITDEVSTDFKTSPTTSVFVTSTDSMEELITPSPSTGSSRHNSRTTKSDTENNANPCKENQHNNMTNLQAIIRFFDIFPAWRGNANCNDNRSQAPNSNVKSTNSTWIDFGSLLKSSMDTILSSPTLLQGTVMPAFTLFITESLRSADNIMAITSSSDGNTLKETAETSPILLSKSTKTSRPTSEASSILLSKKPTDIPRTTQFTKENPQTERTTDMPLDISTTNTVFNTSVVTASPYGITTTEIYTNSSANATVNLTNSNTTSYCPCYCTSVYYLNLLARPSSLPDIHIGIEESLLLDKSLLIAYRMRKNSLYSPEVPAKLIGSTLGILVIVFIFGAIVFSDILSLLNRKIFKK